MSRDVVDALRPATVEGKAVPSIVAELRKYVPDIPRACDKANKLRVVYRGTDFKRGKARNVDRGLPFYIRHCDSHRRRERRPRRP